MTSIVLALTLLQQPAAAAPPPELPVISARLGMCAADFTVKDAEGKPVYGASIRVRIRYGFMSMKRMDLDVGTNSAGKARLDTLPDKAKPLAYEISKGEAKATAAQDLATSCQGTFDISLK